MKDHKTLVSIGNGLYSQTRKRTAASINSIPAKIDRTEYCEECHRYHERPTWPNCTQNMPAEYCI